MDTVEPIDFKSIKIENYCYTLADDRIARFPLEKRDSSKLLVYMNKNITEDSFSNLTEYLEEGSLMAFNNTRVIHARLEFKRETGARIEVFCIEPAQPSDYQEMFQTSEKCQWWCMVGNLKKWKRGTLEMLVRTNDVITTLTAEMIKSNENSTLVSFSWNNDITFGELIDAAGVIPLPPYLDRAALPEDNIRYQTVYSETEGSVAAPTAGLHFTDSVLGSLKMKAINSLFLTLHVGAGTFKPVKSVNISDHEMHNEHFFLNISDLEKLIQNKGKLIAVGTTSVRTLESLYWLGIKTIDNPSIRIENLNINQWEVYNTTRDISPLSSLGSLHLWMKNNNIMVLQSSTRIMIVPGYKFRMIDAIITNFHQPKSTLLLLISAWVGEDWKNIYDYAIKNNFRFLSYGDSSLIYKGVGL
jgi:S-adenosylmethionine:tRNA ribosyltransferase-isomerase